MKLFPALMFLAVSNSVVVPPAVGQEPPPSWAYPVNPPGFKASPDDGSLRKVPDSTVTLTLTQVRDLYFAPDWHPADHPAMPTIVATGRKPGVFACGYCHRADGPGGPENAGLAGLPEAYIIQQMANFKSGSRKSSVMNRAPMTLKVKMADPITDAEIAEAAAYFASLKPRSVVKVVESATAPKTFVTGWFLAADRSGATEPLGDRIIEVADDLERFVSRDSRVTFTAHVPVGSIAKGKQMLADGARTVPCAPCHGPDLKGVGAIPGIAGRSPTYLFRQLYDFKHGARAAPAESMMKPAVEKLTVGEMIALASYAASLAP